MQHADAYMIWWHTMLTLALHSRVVFPLVCFLCGTRDKVVRLEAITWTRGLLGLDAENKFFLFSVINCFCWEGWPLCCIIFLCFS